MRASHVLLGVAVLAIVKETLCRHCSNGFGLCHLSHWQTTLAAVPTALTGHFLWIVFGVHCRRLSLDVRSVDPLLWAIGACTLAHAALLGGSSFVEEEHQTWYYLSASLLAVLCVRDVRAQVRMDRVCRVPGLDKDLTARNIDADLGWPAARWCFRRRTEIAWALVLAMVAALRSLNQTGDKWLSVPDVGDWLVMDEHRGWLSVWVGIGEHIHLCIYTCSVCNAHGGLAALAAMVYRCASFGGLLTNVLSLTASVLIYYYRTQTGAVVFVGFKPSE